MDPVTHSLIGANLANGFYRRRLGPEAVPILVAASNVTDIDAVVHLSGRRTAILMRRTFGHSLFLAPFWGALLAWLLCRIYRAQRWRTVFLLCLLGIGVHLFFDLVNSFGVVLLWPFSTWRPELAIVFIIDLALAGLLAAPLLLGLFPKLRRHKEALSRAAIACAALYVAFCGTNRFLAMRALRQAAKPPSGAFVYAFPEPFGPNRWHGVVLEGGVYQNYLVHSLTGEAERKSDVETDAGRPEIEGARETPLGRKLDWFFKAPVWTSSGRRVEAYDLRFRPILIERREPFAFSFETLPDGSAAPLDP